MTLFRLRRLQPATLAAARTLGKGYVFPLAVIVQPLLGVEL
jgi:hypothetical protein